MALLFQIEEEIRIALRFHPRTALSWSKRRVVVLSRGGWDVHGRDHVRKVRDNARLSGFVATYIRPSSATNRSLPLAGPAL
jgi:hypothetical protein